MIKEETTVDPIPISGIAGGTTDDTGSPCTTMGINRLVVNDGAISMQGQAVDYRELLAHRESPTQPSLKKVVRLPQFRGRWINPLPDPSDPADLFADDPRQNFRPDTSPFWLIGRVESFGESKKVATGALVGPRHILTARQNLPWLEDGGLGPLKFSPGLYSDANGVSTSAAETWAVHAFHPKRHDSLRDQLDIAEDIAVCVLADRIGDQIGWFGTRSYQTRWDGEPVWFQVGYPDVVGGGQQPSSQMGVSVVIDLPSLREPIGGRILVTDAVTSSGDEGGPLFGFWDDGPFIVGVTSRVSPAPIPIPTLAGAGGELVELVKRAIEKFP